MLKILINEVGTAAAEILSVAHYTVYLVGLGYSLAAPDEPINLANSVVGGGWRQVAIELLNLSQRAFDAIGKTDERRVESNR